MKLKRRPKSRFPYIKNPWKISKKTENMKNNNKLIKIKNYMRKSKNQKIRLSHKIKEQFIS